MITQPLERSLRGKLEQAIKDARIVSEAAARAAMEQLGVGEASAFSHLSKKERELRVKLRAHGRLLGDQLNQDKTQEIELLMEEVAYQHWHRMLFARFLAENNLLMYPDPHDPVAITLEECAELAAEDDEARDGWELAARYAAQMLPQIFRLESPVFQLSLPLEHQQKLERLLEELPHAVFSASDSLGWVYQYWQSQKKEEVNASEVKIGARELPAVTQLFTEPYMVSFLLDNALGAWWAVRRLTKEELMTAQNEEELRQKAALPGVPLEYLRFVKDKNGIWSPAAGDFSEWPEHLNEFKVIDPCCGSGHFLVAAFLMLVPMRMVLENLSAEDAADAVLRENLHGLEIDQRCVELAAFALAFTAWRYPGSSSYRKLPDLNLACSGLSVSIPKEEWKKLANGNPQLRFALDVLYEHFKKASVLGSLLNPAKVEMPISLEWSDLSKAMEKALQKERTNEELEAGVVASGLAKAGELLTGKYHWAITNVPYLARGKQSDALRGYCTNFYELSKNDLSTVFLERCLEFCDITGNVSIVLPQNWLFLTRYTKLRERLLKGHTWRLIARLGAGAFETISGEVVKAILLTISYKRPNAMGDEIFEMKDEFGEAQLSGVDVSDSKNIELKIKSLVAYEVEQTSQIMQLANPDFRIVMEANTTGQELGVFADAGSGMCTFDRPRFIINFWNLRSINEDWKLLQSTSNTDELYAGLTEIVKWQQGQGDIYNFVKDKEKYENYKSGIWRAGSQFWGKKGILVSQMQLLPVTIYNRYAFDNNTAAIVPHDEKHYTAIWAYCLSPDYNKAVRRIDQSLKVTTATLVRVPFNLGYWQKVAAEKYPHGLPEPYSDDPTQWIFHGHPCGSVAFNECTGLLEHGPMRNDSTVLQVSVARLLGYRWPAELDKELELSDESRFWVNKCRELNSLADQEGIVCILPVRGEASAADRIIDLLATAYGSDWNMNTLAKLLEEADHADKTLETWLRDKFFTQHCKLFHHRPFIWHVWDGLRDGFSALVNYHKLSRNNLENLIYNYLGDWIKRQKQDYNDGIDGAAEKLTAAENLKKRLELILKGEAPYDIFVRWKPIEQQPMGWNPDLNDGVRLNIRPFMTVPLVSKKGAGVFRDKPNIKWSKDRGKDVPSAPWYHLFKGERINDYHLTLRDKEAAIKEVQPHSLVAETEDHNIVD